MAESAHDPLHARALVFDDGATKLAMVVVDSLGESLCDRAISRNQDCRHGSRMFEAVPSVGRIAGRLVLSVVLTVCKR